jgi:hypothetical protein
MTPRPHRRHFAAALVVAATVAGVTGCTAGAPDTEGSHAATAPQPDIAGEWVVTRTVTASDDTANPAHAVGAVSQRFLLVERDDCAAALCPGTVSSGPTVDKREKTDLTQTDGGFGYRFEGTLDCLNGTTGAVVSVGGFAFTQKVSLTVKDTSGSGGGAKATSLAGTAGYTDTVTEDAHDDGCVRVPDTVTVRYAVTALRAP